MRLPSRVLIIVVSALVMSAAAAFAQEIAGVARDTTGAVLPGVTVEASSPALIEKLRTALTDEAGRYRIVALRPGTYSVTFTLAGFNNFKREGIELTANFTATVNAEMRVGAIEETVTVTGESPTVDVQSTSTRIVMTRDVLDAVPTGRNIQAVGILIPGTTLQFGGGGALSIDVGGSGGMQQSPLTFHGSNDSVQQVNGIRYNNLCGSGQYAGTYWNDGMFQEISYITSGDSAENGQGGMRINMIPKEGGNGFKGTVFGNWTYDPWQGNNLDDYLRGRRLESVNEIDKIWDFNPSFGGPIIRDKLWFQGTYRYWGVYRNVAGSFSEIDPTMPGLDDGYINSRVLHFTWQATQKNKLTAYYDLNQKYRGHWGINSTTSPEAAGIEDMPHSYTTQAKWLSTISNKLLFEAGFGIYYQQYREIYRPEPENPNTPDLLRVHPTTGLVYRPFFATQERSTSQWFGSFRQFQVGHFSENFQYLTSLSYITGSHALKTGLTFGHGLRRTDTYARGDMVVFYNLGRPNQVQLLATPRWQREKINADMGVFVQDKWTINRATLSLGARFDYYNSEVPVQVSPAGSWVPHRELQRVPDVPKWYDLSPRLGISYDLFGNGKTAVKGSVNRYVAAQTAGFAAAANPLGGGTADPRFADTRTWNDANNDRLPQANEFGQTANQRFGQEVSIQRYDDDLREGWFKRGYTWAYSAAIQQELLPRVSAEFGFHKGWTGNLTSTDNALVGLADYDPFCVTVPANDPPLPNAGQQVCGLYDIKPEKRPLVDNVLTFSNNFGERSRVYTGFDATVTARFRNGALLNGGVTSGRTVDNECYVIDNPSPTNAAAIGPFDRDCETRPPFRAQYKFLWSYPLPGDFQVSGSFQSVPGPEILAQYVVTSAQVSGLGRALSAGSATVNLIEPATLYDERMHQVDFRATKRFRMGRTRLQVMADLYNALNDNAVIRRTNRVGSIWSRPDQVLEARMFKMGVQMDF